MKSMSASVLLTRSILLGPTTIRSLSRGEPDDALKMFRAYHRGSVPEEIWVDFAAQAAAMTETPGRKLFFDGHSDVHQDFILAVREHHIDKIALDFTLGRGFTNDA